MKNTKDFWAGQTSTMKFDMLFQQIDSDGCVFEMSSFLIWEAEHLTAETRVSWPWKRAMNGGDIFVVETSGFQSKPQK